MGGRSVILLSSLSVLLVLIHVQADPPGYGHTRCPPGKEYKDCGSPCPPTCADMSRMCAAMCTPGCFCRGKTVLDGHGNCVKRPDCCKGNTIYSECGNDCKRMCPTKKPMGNNCERGCSPGCFCKPGFKRLGDKCVHPRDCPRPFHY